MSHLLFPYHKKHRCFINSIEFYLFIFCHDLISMHALKFLISDTKLVVSFRQVFSFIILKSPSKAGVHVIDDITLEIQIHLFDIDIPGKITFIESKTLTAGETPTIVDTGLMFP